jgi:hypothetical protein
MSTISNDEACLEEQEDLHGARWVAMVLVAAAIAMLVSLLLAS